MKKQIILLSILILSSGLLLNGQSEKKPSLKATSFGFSFGFAGVAVNNTIADYNNLRGTVDNPELFINANDYNSSRYNIGFGGSVSPKFYLGFSPYSKKKGEYQNDREIRFTLGSSSGIRRNFNYYQYNNFAVDTFQSGNTGEVIYSDSSIFNRYIYAESYYDINFGAAFIFKTPVERRFHFNTGVGIEYGIALRSFVKVENYLEESIYYYNINDKPVFNEPEDYGYSFYGSSDDYDGTYQSTTTNMQGAMQFIRTFIPLGINFRIANKESSFFNKVYLFGEMSPGVEIQIVSNDKTYVNPYVGFAMFGFSYRW